MMTTATAVSDTRVSRSPHHVWFQLERDFATHELHYHTTSADIRRRDQLLLPNVSASSEAITDAISRISVSVEAVISIFARLSESILIEAPGEQIFRYLNASVETLLYPSRDVRIGENIETPVTRELLDCVHAIDLTSEGYELPSHIAMQSVLDLARLSVSVFGPFAKEQSEPWTLAPLQDGGLLPEWRGPGGDVEVHIGPEGDLAYVLITEQDGIRKYSSGENVSQMEILRLIARILDA